MVALLTLDLDAEFAGQGPEPPVDLREGVVPVRLGLARAERVEVRTVQYQDAVHGLQSLAPTSSMAASTSRRSIGRGTLAWPIRGVNTQRTRRARFLSRRIAASRRATVVAGMRRGRPSRSSSRTSRAWSRSLRP